MAINNKRKSKDDIALADKEPQKEQKPERGPGFGDTKDDGAGIDIIPTSDYKVNLDGKKYKAHRIVFSNGKDDGRKGVTEQMKKTFTQFAEDHIVDLTEEQVEDAINEVLSKDAKAGDWIDDFVKSDNPKFAGKSNQKRKQMALAAYYAKQRNEGVEMNEKLQGGQVKLDKNKNGKLDAEDFKKLRKEELHQDADKVLKHIKPEHHAKYTPDLAKGTYKGDYADRSAVLKAAERAGHLKEEDMKESVFDWKNAPRQTKDKTKTSTYHDVKKISTGTVYTKQFDKDGTSKGTGGDAAAKAENAPKRGRGRPKKDKFAESVEMLMSLSEEQFDSMMEEGFDAFYEAFEQLDELSKATLGSYAKKAAYDAKGKGFDAGHQEGGAQARSKTMYGGSGAGSATDDKAHKRLRNVSKAIDRLTK